MDSEKENQRKLLCGKERSGRRSEGQPDLCTEGRDSHQQEKRPEKGSTDIHPEKEKLQAVSDPAGGICHYGAAVFWHGHHRTVPAGK